MRKNILIKYSLFSCCVPSSGAAILNLDTMAPVVRYNIRNGQTWIHGRRHTHVFPLFVYVLT